MAQLRATAATPWRRERSVRLARLAARQFGVVSLKQLLELGFASSGISRLVRESRLHRLHPGVYAVGHVALTRSSHVVAALFWAGEDAALSHVTAAEWWKLCDERRGPIHITSRHKTRSRPGIRVHRSRTLEATRYKRLPVTTVPRTLVDVAASVPFSDLRFMLANADHHRFLSVPAVEAQMRRGRRGSAALNRALEIHRPELGHTRSPLERRFVLLLERFHIPMPEFNVHVCGHLVDCHWHDRLVIVELDGAQTHGTVAAVRRDRQRDLDLRRAGYTVRRYSWSQVVDSPDEVAADLRRALAMI